MSSSKALPPRSRDRRQTPALSRSIRGHCIDHEKPVASLSANSIALIACRRQSGYPEYSVSLTPQAKVSIPRRKATLALNDIMMRFLPGIYFFLRSISLRDTSNEAILPAI